jgi:hypothetical protein
MRPTLVAFASLVLLAASARANHPEPNEARLERLRQAEVVVVTGSADHMEQVLKRAQVRFFVVSPDELPNLPLHGQQVLMVNCTGEMSAQARERVRRFVTAGGFLYTTDHAVHYLLEKAFPGFVRWNRQTSTEQIFPMQIHGDRGLLKHLGGQGHPSWQLAGGGYLFEIVDKQRVEVLMSSAQVAAKYGSQGSGSTGVLGVRFRVGDGQVIHVTGHFYTQPGQRPEVAAAGRAFEQLSSNVVAEKAADKPRIDGLYNVAPKREVTLQSAPTAASPAAPSANGTAVRMHSAKKVRVLEKQGGYSRVRDEEGNEGWAPADAF